jgi:nucleoside 2-deoxyribosyltransferase
LLTVVENICNPCNKCNKNWSAGGLSCHDLCEIYKKWKFPKSIYLGGAIDRVSPDFATDWRKKATAVLQEHSFIIYDPTAGKDLTKHKLDEKNYTKETAGKLIVHPDLEMIKKSAIILAEVSCIDRPYHGTSMELVYGHLWKKHIFVWGGCKSSWIIYHSDIVFITLDEALAHIVNTYEGEYVEDGLDF